MTHHADGIGLTLALMPTELASASGRALHCTLELRNRGDRAFWVNRRLAMGHPLSPPHLREVDFLIQDVSGRIAEFTAKVRVGLPRAEEFVELAPGESVERQFDLGLWYSLEWGEEYEVQAIYENHFVPEHLKNERVWTGRLASHALKMGLGTGARALAS